MYDTIVVAFQKSNSKSHVLLTFSRCSKQIHHFPRKFERLLTTGVPLYTVPSCVNSLLVARGREAGEQHNLHGDSPVTCAFHKPLPGYWINNMVKSTNEFNKTVGKKWSEIHGQTCWLPLNKMALNLMGDYSWFTELKLKGLYDHTGTIHKKSDGTVPSKCRAQTMQYMI